MPTATATKDPETYAIIGAVMEVHRQLGCGFLEAVYRDALRQELTTRAIPFQAEVTLPLTFKGRRLATGYRSDLVCFGAIVVELKALGALTGTEAAQIINYLKASGLGRGLVLNFGARRLEYRRFIWSGKAAPSGAERHRAS